jgi:hypothetical protein
MITPRESAPTEMLAHHLPRQDRAWLTMVPAAMEMMITDSVVSMSNRAECLSQPLKLRLIVAPVAFKKSRILQGATPAAWQR